MGRGAAAGKRQVGKKRRARACRRGAARPLSGLIRTHRNGHATMRRFLLSALVLLGPALLAAAPASAQIRQGFYDVEGRNPDGSTYGGVFALENAPGASWYATWQVGDVQLSGLGLIHGGVLAVSFVVDGRPGIATYEVEADGRLRGNWSTGGGMGTEVLTPR